MAFSQVGDARPCRGRKPADSFPQQKCLARIGVDHAGEHFDGGAFARPVAAQAIGDTIVAAGFIDRCQVLADTWRLAADSFLYPTSIQPP